MISLTRLLLGQRGQGDHLRYDRGDREPWYRSSEAALKRRPVVVWNVTGQCNLRCAHCYAASGPSAGEDELTADGLGHVCDGRERDHRVLPPRCRFPPGVLGGEMRQWRRRSR